MRRFEDEQGRTWTASVAERPGVDYKGRYYFVAVPEDGDESAAVHLDDVRWNSRGTAERTLRTMSLGELRRRLRWARERAEASIPGA
ncbi:MAG: hypothetical protein D6701_01625 [Gemmatimonadetes bacterium]|nr:MAG: hypothetical protein D6701_01625 [Gemmatimonadota bacterium]